MDARATTSVVSDLDLMVDDLARSGLSPSDINSRVLDPAVRTASELRENTRGYVIPYYNIYGKLIPFYRVKIFNSKVKYIQMKGNPNHVYFPKNFLGAFEGIGRKFIILTEGEKKAAALVKCGLPGAAFGGVDSWKNKTLVIPKEADVKKKGGALGIRLPSSELEEQHSSTLANGFTEVVDLALKHNATIYICYDRDAPDGVSYPVQRAAARLGYELRSKGVHITKIRQLMIPMDLDPDAERVAIDDVIVKLGAAKVLDMVLENNKLRVAFPRHPTVRDHISKQLQKPRLDRRQILNLSLAVLTELDARGTRMYSPDDMQMYYFNGDNNHLMKVDINKQNQAGVHETEFGMMLYKDYGIAPAADSKFMQWLGAQFAGEEPVELVNPFRIVARPNPGEDIIRVQVNNGQYIKITPNSKEPYRIMPNGAENVLFVANNNLPEDQQITEKELVEQLAKRHNEPLTMWWGSIIKEVRMKHPGKFGIILALLYYISPYLMRWRGTQLPIELVVGEAGTGKSTLCEIRLNILTGDAKLRNSPDTLKDWYASLAHSGGFHVIDNVHMVDKNLKQRISDELCRMVTEPDPRISMRKYFTEADERSIRINNTFGFTAIQMPFTNGDLLQRSIVLELSKNEKINQDGTLKGALFEGNWKDKQIKRFGGRAAWLSHHIYVIHKFLELVQKRWNHNYVARNRLVNLEQCLMLMAEVFGIDGKWIPDYLAGDVAANIGQADWVLEGLIEFAENVRAKDKMAIRKLQAQATPVAERRVTYKTFTVADIATWAETHDEFEKCFTLVQTRSLGKYIQHNKHNVASIAGIVEDSVKNNRIVYRVVPINKVPKKDDLTVDETAAIDEFDQILGNAIQTGY